MALEDRQMRLYHGTAGAYLPKILKYGIKPRGAKGKSNWKHTVKHTVASNPKTVYLNNAYALYYALCAGNEAKAGNTLVLFEIVPALLYPRFVPDEDALEQALRGRDSVQGSMVERTLHYRRKALKLAGPVDSPLVQDSMRALGNCGYKGIIPPDAITRYAVIDRDRVDNRLLWEAMDPSITVLNYQVCGAKYRNMVRWVFEEETEPPVIHRMDFIPPESRAGITLHIMRHSHGTHYRDPN
jgi:hypothetical protein